MSLWVYAICGVFATCLSIMAMVELLKKKQQLICGEVLRRGTNSFFSRHSRCHVLHAFDVGRWRPLCEGLE